MTNTEDGLVGILITKEAYNTLRQYSEKYDLTLSESIIAANGNIQSNYILKSESDKMIEAAEERTADIEFKSGINSVTMSGEYILKSDVENWLDTQPGLNIKGIVYIKLSDIKARLKEVGKL